MSDKVKEYFARWPEEDELPGYEYDVPIGDPKRIEFLMSLSEEDQREILRRLDVPEKAIDRLFELSREVANG